MLLALFLVAASLQQCPDYIGRDDGKLHTCGHAYKLVCSQFGVAKDCEGDMVSGPPAIDHFQVFDERGAVVFARNFPRQTFANVGVSGNGYPGRPQFFTVEVQERTGPVANASTITYTYYFETTSSGLVPFTPAISCGRGGSTELANSDLWPPSGIALACEFNADYFRFMVELEFDFHSHRIVLSKQNSVLPLGGYDLEPVFRPALSSPLMAYRDHDPTSSQERVNIIAGDAIRLLGAWTPISLHESGDISTVIYDRKNVWLQAEQEKRKFWLHGAESFQAIGLQKHLQ
jgi:hypothetical protein